MESHPIEIRRKGTTPVLEKRELLNKDGSTLPVLVFPSLEQCGEVQHLFTTRLGGVSEGVFTSLNLSRGKGDPDENVQENIARVAYAFGTDLQHVVFSRQVHETNVKRVVKDFAGSGVIRKSIWESADGLVTNERGIVLGTVYADCVPLLFVDPVHHAVGCSHSGWRGTVAKMGKKTLEVMRQEFGTNPGDVLVGIGPSICQDHYEVSEDVANQFRHVFPEQEKEILRYEGHPGHEQLNLWEACRITLEEAGVPEENISVTDICTACNPDLLFSHRASQGKHGNFGAFIMLR